MYRIKVKEKGADAWELTTTPNGVSYKLIDQVAFEGRTMDDLNHKAKTSQKVGLTFTFNRDLTEDFVQSLLQAFSHQYISVEYYDPYAGNLVIKKFTVTEREVQIDAWNDNYKRFKPISFSLEER